MPGKTDARKAKQLDSIKQAIMLEIHGLRFYQVAAERCTSQGARELFSDLAEDEVRHRAELETGEAFSIHPPDRGMESPTH